MKEKDFENFWLLGFFISVGIALGLYWLYQAKTRGLPGAAGGGRRQIYALPKAAPAKPGLPPAQACVSPMTWKLYQVLVRQQPGASMKPELPRTPQLAAMTPG